MSSSSDLAVARGRVIPGFGSPSATPRRGAAFASIGAFDRDLVPARTELGEAIEEAREEGRLAGYVVGRQEGTEIGRAMEREAHERARLRAHDAVSRICDAVGQAAAGQAAAVAAMESTVVALALEIAGALVGRELSQSAPEIARRAAARALELVPSGRETVVAVHPDDLALLGSLDDLLVGRPAAVIADPSVERGGAVVSFGAGSVRALPSEAMARIAGALAEAAATVAPEGDGPLDPSGGLHAPGSDRPVFPGDLVDAIWEDER